MRTVTLRTKADEDGILKVEVPTGAADTEFELIVVFQPAAVEENAGASYEVPPPGTAARMVYEAQRADIRVGERVEPSSRDYLDQDSL